MLNLRVLAVSVGCVALVATGVYVMVRPVSGARTSAIEPVAPPPASPSASAEPSPTAEASPSPVPSEAPTSAKPAGNPAPKPSPKAPKVLSVSVDGPSITCDGGKVRFSAHIRSNVELERIVHKVNSDSPTAEQLTMLPRFETTVSRTDSVSASTVTWSMRFEAMDGQKLTKSGSTGHPCRV